MSLYPIENKLSPKVFILSNLFHSKCDSEWDDCIEADEKYLREKTDYYEKYYGDTCPVYSPGSQDDPYPGQPIVENQPKPQPQYKYSNYHPSNQYHYTNHNTLRGVISHATRRQEETKSTGTNCRVYQGQKGERVRCDTNIEIRNVDYQTARDVNVEALDPCQEGTETSLFCFDDEDDFR